MCCRSCEDRNGSGPCSRWSEACPLRQRETLRKAPQVPLALRENLLRPLHVNLLLRESLWRPHQVHIAPRESLSRPPQVHLALRESPSRPPQVHLALRGKYLQPPQVHIAPRNGHHRLGLPLLGRREQQPAHRNGVGRKRGRHPADTTRNVSAAKVGYAHVRHWIPVEAVTNGGTNGHRVAAPNCSKGLGIGDRC